jgi:uncharacterized protein (DUF1697 family)
VVLLRGVNVGGHRRFRPSELAEHLRHFEAVSIGAAGTLVIRRPPSLRQLRLEVMRRLPFPAEVMICQGSAITALMSRDFFRDRVVRPDIVRFVSVLSRTPRAAPPLPMDLPLTRPWLVRILAREHRFVVGLYRRQMKAISQLGSLDRVFGVPATTRSWTTMAAIARVLDDGRGRPPRQ